MFVYPPATTGNNSHCCGFINIHGINVHGFNQIKFPGYVICGQWSKQYNMVSDFDWTMISKKICAQQILMKPQYTVVMKT